MGDGITRRQAMFVLGGGIVTLVTGAAFGSLGSIAMAAGDTTLSFEDGMRISYSPDTDHDGGSTKHHVVAGHPVEWSMCPHIGVPDPTTGQHRAYDLDLHPELLENPASGRDTPVRSAAKVLRMWKIICWYGWEGPGYSWSLWRDLGATANSEFRVTVLQHSLFSQWWLGNALPEAQEYWGITREQMSAAFSTLQAKAEADGFDADRVQLFMIGDPGAGRQELILWRFVESVPKGKLVVKKVVDGADNGDEFTFHVTFSGNGAPSAQTFTLKGGQSKTIDDIPAGVRYAVSEDTPNHYDATWQNRTGTIREDATVTVTCTNAMHGFVRLRKRVDI